MRRALQFAAAALLSAAVVSAQGLTDAEIQAAINRGKASTTDKLWKEIRKQQQIRINRAGLVDAVDKKVTFITDTERVALLAANANEEKRMFTVEMVKRTVPLDVTEVLLEASCYNELYAAQLPPWGLEGGVRLLLEADGKTVPAQEKRPARVDAFGEVPQGPGIGSQPGNAATYIPLYHISLYEKAAQRAWFTFPPVGKDVKSLTVTIVSGEGKQRAKQFPNPLH
jgi:hypothetical protein